MLPVRQHEICPKSAFSHIFTTFQGGCVDQRGQQVLPKISLLKSTSSKVSKTVSSILYTHIVKEMDYFEKSTQNDKSQKIAKIM